MADKTTREQIIVVADQFFYRRGYEYTSFADIADAVNISRGNFYHHFKSKDEILEAVITLRLARTQKMLDQWEAEGEGPAARIRSFIHILVMNQTKIKRWGCPVGTLCTELAKLNHRSQADANRLFSLFRTWLCRQFKLLGRTADADKLAMHLLARSQGVATLANAFRDETFIKQEVEEMCDWLSAHAKSTSPTAASKPPTAERVSPRRRSG